jgi:hypothetical protein
VSQEQVLEAKMETEAPLFQKSFPVAETTPLAIPLMPA